MTAILVVEDELSLLAVTGAFLAENGYAVSSASTAAGALTLLETRTIDVLLTDIVMPGEINGFELARQAMLIHPGLKVIYCTGRSDLEPEQIGHTFGPLLKKPYANSRLMALLEHVEGCSASTEHDLPDTDLRIYAT
jgi:DNA-binding NtrC family response regulator